MYVVLLDAGIDCVSSLKCLKKTDNAVFFASHFINMTDLRFRFAGKYGAFDYISVTPPYMEVDYGILMNQVSKSSVVGEDTFIVSQFLYFVIDIFLFQQLFLLLLWHFGVL